MHGRTLMSNTMYYFYVYIDFDRNPTVVRMDSECARARAHRDSAREGDILRIAPVRDTTSDGQPLNFRGHRRRPIMVGL